VTATSGRDVLLTLADRVRAIEAVAKDAASILGTIRAAGMFAHLPADSRARATHERASEMLQFLSERVAAEVERQRASGDWPSELLADLAPPPGLPKFHVTRLATH